MDLTEKGEGILDSFLLSYSQILFSGDRRVGAMLLSATAIRPDIFLGGLIAVLLTNGCAICLHLSKEAIKKGIFGYNGLLIGLAFPFLFKINARFLVLFVMAVLATTLITASLQASLGFYFNLPVLTLPFLIVMYFVLAAFPSIQGLAWNTQRVASSAFVFSVPEIAAGYFKSLGALFFVPNMISGVIVFISLLFFSRIATLLSMMGYAIGMGLVHWVFILPAEHFYLSIGFNFILTAIAMGGIWFVPHTTSFLFAGGAVLFCALILVGTSNLFYFFGLPVLVLPFNLTALTLLYGMRQRTVDRHPKSVDFLFGTPEANAAYYRTRLARFGANFANKIGLPFLGTWACTQGHDGGSTHQGLWEHAFDFEVRDSSGKVHKNEGKEVSDYLCYKLPILACCDGQVIKVENNVLENPVGKFNLNQNWGNLVMIQHGPALFSMVCHLTEGNQKIKVGDNVRKGDIIGYCGNSGRSPVPHLHFQLQNTARVGAPTIYSEFHEIILAGESPSLLGTYVPKIGDAMRNVCRQEEMADHFNFSIGQKISFICHFENKAWEEVIESTIDLYGNLKLLSLTKKAVLYFENKNNVFVIYDYLGGKDSALFVFYIAVPKVPYELVENLTYCDTLPARHFLSWSKRILTDFTTPFFSPKGMTLTYHCERRGGDLAIFGRSGDSKLETQAVFREGKGWGEAYMAHKGKKFEVISK